MISNAQLAAALIALVASSLAGILRKDGKPEWFNATISAFFLLVAAVISVIVAGSLNGNIPADIGTISTEVGILMIGPLKCLEAFLQVSVNAGPKAPSTPPSTPSGGKPLLTMVPARSSAVTQATGWKPTAQAWTTPDQSG